MEPLNKYHPLDKSSNSNSNSNSNTRHMHTTTTFTTTSIEPLSSHDASPTTTPNPTLILSLEVDKSKFFDANFAVLEGDVIQSHLVNTSTVIKEEVEEEEDKEENCSSNSSNNNNNNAALPLSSLSSSLTFLKPRERCMISIRKNVTAMYQTLVPTSISSKRTGQGQPVSTGWLRHELFGLVVTVHIPLPIFEQDCENGGTRNKKKKKRKRPSRPMGNDVPQHHQHQQQHQQYPPSDVNWQEQLTLLLHHLPVNKRGIKSLDFVGEFICLEEMPLNIIDMTKLTSLSSKLQFQPSTPTPSVPLLYSAYKDDILTIEQSELQERSTRHDHFAKWLLSIFGREVLSSGSGVLDVAGGNGKLSMALANLGIPSTILDPHPTMTNVNNANRNSNSKSATISVIPLPLTGNGSTLLNPTTTTLAPAEQQQQQQQQQERESNHVTNTTTADNNNNNINNNIQFPMLYNNTEIAERIRTCSVIVGLHPDQATEPLVDMALSLSKPFAVLPCCVMSKLFPQRRLKQTGEPVRTVWALCRYLLDKSPTTTNNNNSNNNNNNNPSTGLLESTTNSTNNNGNDSIDNSLDNTSATTTSTKTTSTKTTFASSLSTLSSIPAGFQVGFLPFAGRNKVIYWNPRLQTTSSSSSSPLDESSFSNVLFCQPIASMTDSHSRQKGHNPTA